MIEDLSALKTFLKSDQCTLASLTIGDTECFVLKMRTGQVIVRERHALPVVDGKTISSVFGETNAARYAPLLQRPPQPTQELERVVVVPGATNYYHFLAFNLPGLLLLRFAKGERVTLATVLGFPGTAAALLAKLLPMFAGNRPVDIVNLPDADYAVRDIIFRAKPLMSTSIAIARLVQRTVLEAEGIADPYHSHGPVKLFVRRQGGANGRNLINQAEVEAWFVARGYLSVDPGTMTMEEQIVLFSRASRIVGVEGAALANMAFATHATGLVILASPNVRGDAFFAELASAAKLPFVTAYGDVAAVDAGNRTADFAFPPGRLEALPCDDTVLM